MSALRADIADIESRRRVKVTEELINADIPAVSDPHILATLEAVCAAEKIPFKKMVSRAYHDTSFMALPQRRLPPPRRVRHTGVHRARHTRPRTHAGPTLQRVAALSLLSAIRVRSA